MHQFYTLLLLGSDLFSCLHLHLKCFNLSSLGILHRSLPLQLLLILARLVFVVLDLHLEQNWLMLLLLGFLLMLVHCRSGLLYGLCSGVKQELRVVVMHGLGGLSMQTVGWELVLLLRIRDYWVSHWQLLWRVRYWRGRHYLLGRSLSLRIHHIIIGDIVVRIRRWLHRVIE